MTTTLTAEALLTGGSETFEVEVPAAVLAPGRVEPSADAETDAKTHAGTDGGVEDEPAPGTVTLRPLRLGDLQRIGKAAPDSNTLTSVLMVQQALVEPPLTVDQVNRLHAGLVEFLVGEVNRISGLRLDDDELADAVQAPMARACFTLSREFGWTPDECAQLTLGQVLLYLEMLGRGERWDAVRP